MKTQQNKVDELHLKYLEASFEGFRRASFSLILLNAGAILALIGLFPVIAPSDIDLAAVASGMKCPLVFFLFGILTSVISLVTFSLSAHTAAWGEATKERQYRSIGIALVFIAMLLFGAGSWSAFDAISQPTLIQQQID